ncbi:MAG: hypothetical protein IT381_03125 [Deltaproteobacteria bacterium]|nr:hypothetical protein [Deltaproteobacteria bacterium]
MRRLCSALVLSTLVLATSDCRRKRRPPVTSAPTAPTEEKTATNADKPLPMFVAGDADNGERAEVRVAITMNGAPLPEGVSCEGVAFAEGSSRDPLGRSPCGLTMRFPGGRRDLEVTLRAGETSTTKRLPTDTYGKSARVIPLDMRWEIGRARLQAELGPEVSGCRVRYLRGGAVVGETAAGESLSLEAGSYAPRFVCTQKNGEVFSVDAATISVRSGQDTTGKFAVTAPVAGAVAPTDAAPTPTQRTATAPAPRAPTENIIPTENKPRDPGRQSADPRELPPQNYKENP